MQEVEIFNFLKKEFTANTARCIANSLYKHQDVICAYCICDEQDILNRCQAFIQYELAIVHEEVWRISWSKRKNASEVRRKKLHRKWKKYKEMHYEFLDYIENEDNLKIFIELFKTSLQVCPHCSEDVPVLPVGDNPQG